MRIIQDLPFQSPGPAALGARAWALVMLALVLGFAVLVTFPITEFPISLVPATLFAVLPLTALAAVTGQHWRDLFRPLRWHSFGLMLLFGLLTMALSVMVGLLLHRLVPLGENPVANSFTGLSALEFILRLLPTAPQLLGEELLAILPMLAVYGLIRDRFGDRSGLLLGVIVGTLIFSASHLPTYDWNVVQCFALIGTARIVLTLAYLLTRNIWVSAGAHIVNDWSEFTLIWIGADLAQNPI